MKTRTTYQYWLRRLVVLVLLVALVEALLRVGFGFGQLPLYYSSTDYEYALLHSQHVQRFGRTYAINEFGMRSDPLPSRSAMAGELRILKMGDSVLNGGVLTDQSELSSSHLQRMLRDSLHGVEVNVMHVSAGSWGPDNAFAWLSTHGHFDACIIVLVFSSHDWQDQMTFLDVVGNVAYYPSRQPRTAIGDLTTWAWSRRIENISWNELPYLKKVSKGPQPFNPGWESIARYCIEEGIALAVYHHATTGELQRGTWDEDGQLLEIFLAHLGVPVVSGLSANLTPDDYRDYIHPKPSGQEKIALALEPVIRKMAELELH